jgi:trigger factor
MEFNEAAFTGGKPHSIKIECDLWPEMVYAGVDGYKGLTVTVNKNPVDSEKLNKVKDSIRQRYKVLSDTPVGYSAKMGDVVVANMQGFMANEDGTKGESLPPIASGDQAEIELVSGKFMDGLAEGLVDAQINDVREIPVTFPIRAKGPGVALSGKKAIFQLSVINVKTKEVPEWTQELANEVRPGMTLAELNEEVNKAVDGEGSASTEGLRNEKLAEALLSILQIEKLPESLMEENTQQRFQSMLIDFQEQGSSQEQLEEMTTPEKYAKYKEISKPNVEKVVKLGMAFRDIAEKEKLVVEPAEVQNQIDVMNAQAKQKGEAPPDEARAKDEIQNVLLRKMVFDFLAAQGTVTWIETPTEVEPTPFDKA